MASLVYPLGKRGQIIGLPYTGTHGKAFNIAGGSDNWESENAIDIAAKIGTHLIAVADGVIGPEIGSLGSGGRFAGLRMHLVTHGNEWYYAHASHLYVRAGQAVRQGQVIGASGEANGVQHLHIACVNGSPLSQLQNAPIMDGVGHSRVGVGNSGTAAPTARSQNQLAKYDHVYPTNSKTQIPQADVAAIARSVGFPADVARLFGHVAFAESSLEPGQVSFDHGYGLWQITGHPDLVARFGNMLNPFNNAKAAYVLWRQGGMQPWAPSRYGGDGGGWAQYATGTNPTPRGPSAPKANPLGSAVFAPGVPQQIGFYTVAPGPSDEQHDYHSKVEHTGKTDVTNAAHLEGHANAVRGLLQTRILHP